MSLQTENSVISDGASATANKGTVPQLLVTCPICDGTRLDYVFAANGLHVVQCRDCRLMLLNPQPEAGGAALPSDLAHSFENEALESHSRVSEARRAYARRCLREIARYDGRNGGELVQIGCGEGD
jgi:hypothetical protein